MESWGKNETWPSPASVKVFFGRSCIPLRLKGDEWERQSEGRGAGRASSHNKSPLAGEIRRTCVLPNYRALPPSLPPFSRKTGHDFIDRLIESSVRRKIKSRANKRRERGLFRSRGVVARPPLPIFSPNPRVISARPIATRCLFQTDSSLPSRWGRMILKKKGKRLYIPAYKSVNFPRGNC